MSMKCFRNCLKWYKFVFKNVQATKRRVEELTSLTNREEALTNWDATCRICFKKLVSPLNVRVSIQTYSVYKENPKAHFSSLGKLLFWDLRGSFTVYSFKYLLEITCILLVPVEKVAAQASAIKRTEDQRRELEVHVGAYPHQRSLRGTELGWIISVKFTTNDIFMIINFYLI